jgi:hypothetical protein
MGESIGETEKFFRDCIRNLLEGLEVLEIDDFMNKHLSPKNCLELGRVYVAAVKARIAVPPEVNQSN